MAKKKKKTVKLKNILIGRTFTFGNDRPPDMPRTIKVVRVDEELERIFGKYPDDKKEHLFSFEDWEYEILPWCVDYEKGKW